MTADEFRQIAIALPETEEGWHMGHPDFRVGGKVFASLGPDLTWGMAKLKPEDQQQFLRSEPADFAPASGKWGEGGATVITLENANEDSVRSALNAAWRNIAPAKLVSKRTGIS